jgi:hypothetical protein
MGFRVMDVQAAIRAEAARPGRVPVLAEYAGESRSRKGGSIQYLLWVGERLSRGEAGRRGYVAYTDADISTDLMQTGLLVAEIRDGASAAIGSSERLRFFGVRAEHGHAARLQDVHAGSAAEDGRGVCAASAGDGD